MRIVKWGYIAEMIMKKNLSFVVFCVLTCVASQTLLQGALIDLSKPLSDSISPSGVYWNFNQGTIGDTSTVAQDQTSNGYNGTLYSGNGNSPVYAPGRFGNGISLVDSSASQQGPRVTWDGGTHSGDNTALDLTSSFTMGTWVKFNDYNAGSQQKVHVMERGISHFADSSIQRNFVSFYLQKWGVDTWSPTLWLGNGERVVTLAPIVADRTTAFNDLDWHHVAVTLQTTDSGIEVQFFVDGIALGDAIQSDFILGTVLTNNDRLFTLGERNASSYQGVVNAVFDEAFVTDGAHTFMIPEPADSVAFLLGAFLIFGLSRRLK